MVATLRVPWRPWTTNAERRMVPMERARLVREWREGAAVLAVEQRLPVFSGPVAITVEPHCRPRGRSQDVAACLPAVKAAVDGLCDARVLPHDGPEVVRSITFVAPVVGHDGLVIRIEALDGEVA